MKKTTATTSVEVNVYCPYCDSFQNIFEHKKNCYDDVREEFAFMSEMRSDDCDIEVECESCKEKFIVNQIDY